MSNENDKVIKVTEYEDKKDSEKYYDISEEQLKCFHENISYIIDNIEKNLVSVNKLNEEKYFEVSKEQIIKYFEELLFTINNWQNYFDNGNILRIQREYSKIEGEISELELCLADYDNIFHCDGISYSLYKIGKLLVEILKNKNMKEGNENGR